MRMLKDFQSNEFDLAIYGLGFESRSVTAFRKYLSLSEKNIVLGYHVNTDKFSYQKNLQEFEIANSSIYEPDDNEVVKILADELSMSSSVGPLKVLIDITVMSRHRLALALCLLIDSLPQGSIISVVYSLSEFISPPEDTTPIKKVCEIVPNLSGTLGDLSLPTAVVIGLGYEKNKALGVSNLLDAGFTYIFIPESPIEEFKNAVLENNKELLLTASSENLFYYDVSSPYTTYLALRSLILTIREHSRPLLVPLGPKILSSLSVILGKELHPELPVWRVSSDHTELPVDRPPSGYEISYSLEL